MRNILIGAALAGGLGFLALPASAAQYLMGGIEKIDNSVQQAQGWDRRRCERLRRACKLKDERGERGEGNCRRYREQCGRWWR